MLRQPQAIREETRDEVVLDSKFRVLASLGERAGEVLYAGVHLGTGREVELHLLPSGLSVQSPEGERLLRAARASGRAPHSNVLNVVDSGTDAEGRVYVVYERFGAETLAERVKREGPLAPGQLREVMTQVLSGLGALHARGVVHRYLRSENVLIEQGTQPKVKLADLGYARVTGKSKHTDVQSEVALPRGYSRFLAPELRRGEVAASVASDVYAAGILMRFLATGDTEPNVSVSPEFAASIARATAEDPEERFVSAAHFSAVIGLVGSDAGSHEGSTIHDALSSDLQYMLQRRASYVQASSSGQGRLELYPVLLMIEALYARLGAAGWQALVREVPEAAGLLPAAGNGDIFLEQGVPTKIVASMLAAADSLGGRGDLSLVVDVGVALSRRGLARFCRDLPTISSMDGVIDCAHRIWAGLSRHGEVRVLDRKARSARLEVRGQVEPTLELLALLLGLMRAEIRAFEDEGEVHLSACHAVGDTADVFVLSLS